MRTVQITTFITFAYPKEQGPKSGSGLMATRGRRPRPPSVLDMGILVTYKCRETAVERRGGFQ